MEVPIDKVCISCKRTKNVRHKGPKWVNCYRKEDNPQIIENIKRYNRTHDYTISDRYNKGKVEAKSRKIKWKLDKNQYLELNGKPCFYCGGSLPKAGVGLDRISLDKAIGYSIENVVPCCTICNSVRGDKLSVQETLSAMQAVKETRMKVIDNIHEYGYDIDNRTLFIFNEINEDTVANYLKGLALMENINKYAPIKLKIMSGGGDWYWAIALYDRLEAMQCSITTEGMGLVGSAT